MRPIPPNKGDVAEHAAPDMGGRPALIVHPT